MLEINKIHLGDCLELMKEIPDKSIDMILCDLPYGTTACKWDTIIPLAPLWQQYSRIIKNNRAIVLTATQPFASKLIMSNPNLFKYEWIWDKKIPSGMSYARFQPMRQHEIILIFGEGKLHYNPQLIRRDVPIKEGGKKKSESAPIANFNHMGGKIYDFKNPTTILQFDKVRKGSLHPTQKPIPLFEYLIKTYTDDCDIVLDNCIGSGTTAIACLNTNRNFIGIEKDEKYYQIACERVANHTK